MLCAAGEWFCSAACQFAGGQQTDHIRNYSWYRLLDLCHRDAIREADGLFMITMWLWRVNMMRFWNGNHSKYLGTGHRLLVGLIRGSISIRNFDQRRYQLRLTKGTVFIGPPGK